MSEEYTYRITTLFILKHVSKIPVVRTLALSTSLELGTKA